MEIHIFRNISFDLILSQRFAALFLHYRLPHFKFLRQNSGFGGSRNVFPFVSLKFSENQWKTTDASATVSS